MSSGFSFHSFQYKAQLRQRQSPVSNEKLVLFDITPPRRGIPKVEMRICSATLQGRAAPRTPMQSGRGNPRPVTTPPRLLRRPDSSGLLAMTRGYVIAHPSLCHLDLELCPDRAWEGIRPSPRD